jgi:MinD-like ATPase involved in chromosome partitioning or flagellar assembly
VLTACWSVKGGTGTTVVAASLVLAAVAADRPVVAADFAGDLALTLGLTEPKGSGLLDWLAAGPDVPRDALARIAHSASDGMTLLTRGDGSLSNADAEAGRRLAAAIRSMRAGGPVIADCGRVDSPALAAFVDSADRSLLVLRNCYVALQRAVRAAQRPTAVVLVTEWARSLRAADVEDVLGVPVVTEIRWEPAVARAVDSGLMRTRLPKNLMHAMREVAA